MITMCQRFVLCADLQRDMSPFSAANVLLVLVFLKLSFYVISLLYFMFELLLILYLDNHAVFLLGLSEVTEASVRKLQ